MEVRARQMLSEESGPRAFLSFSFHRLSRRILMMAATGVVALALSAAAAALIVRMSSVAAHGAAQATAERRPLSPLPPMALDSTDSTNPYDAQRDTRFSSRPTPTSLAPDLPAQHPLPTKPGVSSLISGPPAS